MKLIETVITVSVLGTEPYTGDLSELSDDTMTGDFSGIFRDTTTREVTDRDEQLRLCDEHGSDIEFFGPDDDDEEEDTL